MSTPIVSTPYANRGVDAGGFDTFPVGVKAPAFLVGASGSEVALPSSGPALAAGSTLTLTETAHNGRMILLNTTTGSVVTLPASTGNGARYRFLVSVLATSNSHIVKVANSTDVMKGLAFLRDDTSDNAVGFGTGASDDTITLNRTTTGSVVVGEYIEIEDYAAGFFRVLAHLANTGTPATPFSATV